MMPIPPFSIPPQANVSHVSCILPAQKEAGKRGKERSAIITGALPANDNQEMGAIGSKEEQHVDRARLKSRWETSKKRSFGC